MTQGGPQFPDPMQLRQPLRPGATQHRAGLSIEQRLQALEQGALGRPGPGVVDGSSIVSDASQQGGARWEATRYACRMYLANSGSPTHTSNGNYQKVGSGGGTGTWTSLYDYRPSGVSAQVDTTNKRINIRKDGVYVVSACVAFSSIATDKTTATVLAVNGTRVAETSNPVPVTGGIATALSTQLDLNDGDYIELQAFQNDSASEAYLTAVAYYNFIAAGLICPT